MTNLNFIIYYQECIIHSVYSIYKLYITISAFCHISTSSIFYKWQSFIFIKCFHCSKLLANTWTLSIFTVYDMNNDIAIGNVNLGIKLSI